MNRLGRLFQAERVKWRKSWTLLTVILAPVCQSGFLTIIIWFSESLVRRFKPGFEFWIELNYLAWGLLFLPIVVALTAELSWDLETESRTWNLLLVQPVSRGTHYLVKFISHLSLVTLAQLLLAPLVVLEGFLLQHELPAYWESFPPMVLLRFGGFLLLASVPLVAFHTWLSTRLPGIGYALIAALGGTWICARLAGSTALVQFLPWGMTSEVVVFFDRWKRHIPWEYYPGALLCAGLVLWLGTLDFARDKTPKR